MRETLRQLYQLQQIDTRLAEVEKARKELDSGAALRAECDAQRAKLSEESSRLHALETEIRDKELQLKSIEDKRQRHRNRLYSGTITNPKEIENLNQEVEALGRQKGNLEEIILLLMDDVEAQQRKVDELRQALSEKESHLRAVEQRYQETLAQLNAEWEALQAQRAQMVPHIEANALRRYEFIRGRARNLAIVKVKEDICPACSVTFATVLFRRLRET
ncbi:MAG: hypothetical protein NZT92_20945, partial [Abditibacteriales bacterium]|nr:hypothetical protein [Abditibacteriales bacterium]MDW8366037.1 hypothetical protein [Abditibacteriales bacterium]